MGITFPLRTRCQEHLTQSDFPSFMLRKLFALVSGTCCPDNADSPANHEVMLAGHLYGNIIREQLEMRLSDVRTQILTDLRKGVSGVNFHDRKVLLTSNKGVGLV